MTLPEEVVNELTPEMIEQIENTSLEDLLEDLTGIEDTVTNVESGDLPETEIAPALESLRGMIQDLRHSGSISRAEAQSILSMTTSLEGFDTTFSNMPLASFTELPSKVNFQPAMEGLVGNVVKAVIEAIKRVIAWLREKGKALLSAIRGRAADIPKAEAASKKAAGEFKPVTRADVSQAVEIPEKASPKVAALAKEVAKESLSISAPELVSKVMDTRQERLIADLNDFQVRFAFKKFGKGNDLIYYIDHLRDRCPPSSMAVSSGINYSLGTIDFVYTALTGESSLRFEEVTLGSERGIANANHNLILGRHALTQITDTVLQLGRSTDEVDVNSPEQFLLQLANSVKRFKQGQLTSLSRSLSVDVSNLNSETAAIQKELERRQPEDSFYSKLQEKAIYYQLSNVLATTCHRLIEFHTVELAKMAKLLHRHSL